MSSILTNNSAMVALQTLKSINNDLTSTQSVISTGKEVSSAKDNAAVWSISKTMESDVKGFKAISDSLSLGESTVAVARNASETVTDLLTDIKGKIVAAQEENVDRSKLQDDISALTEQIKSVVGAAQFNGQNLVDGSNTGTNTNGNTGIDVLSSLDRDSSGTVSASSIGVDTQNLSTSAGLDITAGTGTGSASVATLAASGGADDVDITGFTFLDTSGAASGGSALKASTAGVDDTVINGFVVGDEVSLKIGDIEGTYRISEGDTDASVATGLKDAMQNAGLSTDDFSFDLSTAGTLTIENLTSEANIAVEYGVSRGSGALAGLENIDVVNDAAGALSEIENMLDGAIDAAAAFGSVEGRLETQADFISNLSDSLTSGIGSMVDADMEETSARLQALQVQQQLGIQSLSIANQSPQSILSLFG
ncbi:flagellin [Octadecabacter sp. 1_MG-2023]|uniref:flagellin N-terminal helical domain-containing protein n=1 Tax=unclassified Octadecabacter TaxID=196158 RepID=UPI001C08B7E5|nr:MULTISPECIES: flagellin [unclassified Octadecabacter]MBU2992395.1 flagellin [Octadecabacter sp. B2R22]MDO6734848.1 flagellin [Octadecabacter sp. 1_MG-2023]